MSYGKIDDEIFELQSKMCKSISHPTRLKIPHLLRGQELTVSEISEKLDTEQSNILQHLRVFRSTDMVEDKKEDLNVYSKKTNQVILEGE